jgi:cystathionine beta-lyase/cystathionine gamma-synthase
MARAGLRREDFPVLDRLTYLNTASVGLVPASVVTPAHEFELELARAGTTGMDEDTGCQVRLVGVLDDPDSFDVDNIAGSVDSATAAICISHIQYLTGHLLDLGELAALAHENGAVLIVDATRPAGPARSPPASPTTTARPSPPRSPSAA